MQPHRAPEGRAGVVQLDAVDARGQEVGPERLGRLVPIDELPGPIDEDEVVIATGGGQGPPDFEGADDVRIDRHRTGAPGLLPVQVNDAVCQVEAAPGERRHFVERLVHVFDRVRDLFDLATESLFATPAGAGEEAIEYPPAEVDLRLASPSPAPREPWG